jgi:histone H2A
MSSRKVKRGPIKKFSKSVRAGLKFPVGRIERFLRKGRYATRVSAGAPVYMAAVIEYIMAEVLELAGNSARDCKHVRITPRDIVLAVRNDEELEKMFHKVTIASGGVIPNIHAVLVPNPKGKKNKGNAGAEGDKKSKEDAGAEGDNAEVPSKGGKAPKPNVKTARYA